jgi:hypothetical protein
MLEHILEAPNVESFVKDLGEHNTGVTSNPLKLMIWVLRVAGWRAVWDILSQVSQMGMRHREADAFYADKKFVSGDGHDSGNCW